MSAATLMSICPQSAGAGSVIRQALWRQGHCLDWADAATTRQRAGGTRTAGKRIAPCAASPSSAAAGAALRKSAPLGRRLNAPKLRQERCRILVRAQHSTTKD